MMGLRLWAVGGLLGLAMGSAACSGTEGDTEQGSEKGVDGGRSTGAPVATGLPREQTLSSLNDAQVERACSALGSDVFLRLGPDACILDGAFSAGFSYVFSQDVDLARAECAESVQACEQCFEDPTREGCSVVEPEDAETDEGCSQNVRTCDATVGTLEDCLNGYLELLDEALEDAPACDELEADDFAAQDDDTDPIGDVPACRTLEERCPGRWS